MMKDKESNPFTKEQVQKICDLAFDGRYTVHLEHCVLTDGCDYYDREYNFLIVPLTMKDIKIKGWEWADFYLKIYEDGFISYENNGGCKFKFDNCIEIYKIVIEAFEGKDE